uniref:Uncharacterized protein n=1 Tax=Triticum urartu TaxID=4572 RepID=A0A8R7TSW8_TRIUA
VRNGDGQDEHSIIARRSHNRAARVFLASLAHRNPHATRSRDLLAVLGVDVSAQVGVPGVPAQAPPLLPEPGAARAGRGRAPEDHRGARPQRPWVALRARCNGRPAHRARRGEHGYEEQHRAGLHGFS